MNLRASCFLALFAVLTGCGTKSTETSVSSATPEKTAAESNGSSASISSANRPGLSPTAKASQMFAKQAGDSGSTPKQEVPKEFQNAAYDYYGLANTKAIDLELTRSSESTVITGSEKTTLVKVEPEQVVYSIEYTGGLESLLGSEQIALRKDGVHVLSSTMEKVDPKEFELPADLTPGKKWNRNSESAKAENDMTQNLVNEVVGNESVSTKLGKFDKALLVKTTGTGAMNGQKLRIESKSWYVKGLGMVRADFKVTVVGGKEASVTVQAVK